MAGAAQHLFVSGGDQSVMRIDPATNCVDGIASVGGSPDGRDISLFAGDEGLYVAFDHGALALFDPATLSLHRSVRLTAPTGMIFLGGPVEGFGSVWYPTFAADTVLKVHPLG